MSPTVDVRPRRLTRVCWAVAIGLTLLSAVVARALGNVPEGEVRFRPGDQVAFFVLGLLIAGCVLLFTRARVVADAAGVSVRNPVSSKRVPWQVVRAVRLDDGAPWAVLELQDDETVQLLAVQSHDGDLAVDAVVRMRALLKASRGGGT